MDVRTLRFYMNAVISPLGIIFNCLLFYTIVMKTSKQLAKYKKVMYLGVISDLIYGFGATVFAPSTAMHGGLFFVTMDGLFGHLGQPFITYGYAYCIFANYLTISALPVQYIYRLIVICFKKECKWYIFMILLSIFLSACGFLSWQCLMVPAETLSPTVDKIVRIIGWADPITGQLPTYGATKLKYVPGILFTGYIIIMVNYSIIILCSIAVFFKIKRQLMITTLDFKIHRQITFVLFIEAMTPFITIVLPILSDLMTANLSIDTSFLGPVRKIVSCFHPFFNPILKCFIIGDYRKFLTSLFKSLLTRQSSETIVTINQIRNTPYLSKVRHF